MKPLSPPILVPTLALLALPVALLAAGRTGGVSTPTRAQAPSASAVEGLPAPQAGAVVAAAEAFAATLTAEQRAKVQSDMTAATVSRWSNLPTGFVPRNGLRLGDLKPAQLAAALRLARTALGEDGYARFEEIRAADDLLAKDDRGGGPGGPGRPGGGRPGGGPLSGNSPGGGPGGDGPGGNGFGGPPEGGVPGAGGQRPNGPGGQRGPGGVGGPGGLDYGAGNYYVAFLGKPSGTMPWMLQIGGHHLAFNLYYRGATGTATPYFVGTEPTTWTDAKGKTHAPLAPMRDAMAGLLASLTPEQRSQAKLSQRFSDVYLGPRANGRFPAESAGVLVASLSPESQAFVRRAIAAWTGDNASAAEYRKLYDAELARTKVAFSGDPALKAHGDYVRIDGPHVWIEFVCQDGIVYRQKIHYHTIWRDRKTDYGASYAF